jgi:eukaryotic-like serine/threonine-protein kinase
VPCLSARQIEQLARGELGTPEAEPLHAHLATCTVCGYAFEECRADADLLAGLKGLGEPAPAIVPAPPTSAPQQIGRYRIQCLIGSGGMGTVYEAVQEQPRRVVALKVLKQGLLSSSALRRFEHEAEVLARLRHPGIAQIYEAGTHDGGSGRVPFIAMEYVPAARPVTAWARERKLGVRACLELCLRICDAVHHGHQRGVIHRDLKPANILVDGQGDVKIIDFGVARATESDDSTTTLHTQVGQLVGTLQYMSPEQCAADPHDIDVRSDVYALGLILYELLTGRLPYEISGRPVHDATRIVREQPPAQLRTFDPALGGDLQTIVLKALEKDRERRYQSALELAQDIRNYLAGEAIRARPPTLVYQLRIFGRRHRALVGATAAVFCVLVAGVIVSTASYMRAENARVEAAYERDHALAAERQTAAINAFLKDMLGGLDPLDAGAPLNTPATETTVRQLLARGSARVAQNFAGSPALQAEVRDTLAKAFYNLGYLEESQAEYRDTYELCRRLLGPDDPRTLATARALGIILLHLGNRHEAAGLARTAYDGYQRLLGPTHIDTIRQASNLAYTLGIGGRYAEMQGVLGQILPLPAEIQARYPGLAAICAHNLAWSLMCQGRLGEAEALVREALQIAETQLGPEHVRTAYTRMMLGQVLAERGQTAAAAAALQRACEDYRKQYGEAHPFVRSIAVYLLDIQTRDGQSEQVEPALRALLAMQQRELGEQNPHALDTALAVSRVLMHQRQYAEAEQLARATAEVMGRCGGAFLFDIYEARDLQAQAYYGLGRLAEAEQTAREVVTTAEESFPTGYYHLPEFRVHWAACLTDLARFEPAERQLQAARAANLEMRGPDHPGTQAIEAELARLHAAWTRTGRAAELGANDDPGR